MSDDGRTAVLRRTEQPAVRPSAAAGGVAHAGPGPGGTSSSGRSPPGSASGTTAGDAVRPAAVVRQHFAALPAPCDLDLAPDALGRDRRGRGSDERWDVDPATGVWSRPRRSAGPAGSSAAMVDPAGNRMHTLSAGDL